MKQTKLKMHYGGGGTVMDDLRTLAKAYDNNLLDLIPLESSLNFFVQCSEERLYRIRNGMRLKEALAEHKRVYAQHESRKTSLAMSPSDKDRLARVVSTAQKLPKLKKHTEDYFEVDKLLETKPSELSGGMVEYMKVKRFDADLERKKHNHLHNYFMEKYYLVSHILDEDVLRSKLAQSVSQHHLMKQTKTLEFSPTEPKVSTHRQGPVGVPNNWIQDLNAVEEEVLKRVEDEFLDKLRRKSEMRRLSEETGKLLKEQKKRSKKKSTIMIERSQMLMKLDAGDLVGTETKTMSEDMRNLSTQMTPNPSATPMSRYKSSFVSPLDLTSKNYSLSSNSSPKGLHLDPIKMIKSSINDLNSLNAMLLKNVGSKKSSFASPKLSISHAVQKALSFTP